MALSVVVPDFETTLTETSLPSQSEMTSKISLPEKELPMK